MIAKFEVLEVLVFGLADRLRGSDVPMRLTRTYGGGLPKGFRVSRPRGSDPEPDPVGAEAEPTQDPHPLDLIVDRAAYMTWRAILVNRLGLYGSTDGRLKQMEHELLRELSKHYSDAARSAGGIGLAEWWEGNRDPDDDFLRLVRLDEEHERGTSPFDWFEWVAGEVGEVEAWWSEILPPSPAPAGRKLVRRRSAIHRASETILREDPTLSNREVLDRLIANGVKLNRHGLASPGENRVVSLESFERTCRFIRASLKS